MRTWYGNPAFTAFWKFPKSKYVQEGLRTPGHPWMSWRINPSEIEAIYSYLESDPYIYFLCDDPFLRTKGYHKATVRHFQYVILFIIDDENRTVYISGLYHEKEFYAQKLWTSGFIIVRVNWHDDFHKKGSYSVEPEWLPTLLKIFSTPQS